MKTIATHNHSFHADDVFGVATLLLIYPDAKVIRTRDEGLIAQADIVLDVGRIYDESKLRFDHHQEGGAGVRENGIPYASFGLIWKRFGKELCVSQEEIDNIDTNLVQVVDAEDNGFTLFTPVIASARLFSISSVIGCLNPVLSEKQDFDLIFMQAVEIAKTILCREIVVAKELVETKRVFRETYKKSSDKRFVILEKEYSRSLWGQCVEEFPELLFVVVPREQMFALRAVRKNASTFENRKDLPLTWAGKVGKELEEITGVVGANFCHNKRFVANAKTKEAILALLDKALNE